MYLKRYDARAAHSIVTTPPGDRASLPGTAHAASSTSSRNAPERAIASSSFTIAAKASSPSPTCFRVISIPRMPTTISYSPTSFVVTPPTDCLYISSI